MHGIILTGTVQETDYPQFRRSAGGHRIATFLREKGWDIEVLDFLMSWELEELKEFTRSRVNSKTVWIGVGGTFPIHNITIEMYLLWFKETYPSIKIIVGGNYPHHFPTADWYVTGFGEYAIDALLKHICGTSTEPLKYTLGHYGKKTVNGNTDYPSYPMKSLRIKYEDRDFILEKETLMTELGRGCIFNCSFCNFPVLGIKEDHTRDAEDFYLELQDTYDRFGVTKYTVSDETVNDYTAKLEKFAGATRRLSFQPRLFGFARADLLVARKQDWDLMIEMGFVGHHYGLESTNRKSLKAIGKNFNPDKVLPGLIEARNYFRKHGYYRSTISIIAGLPYETRESFNSMIEWLDTNWKYENTYMFPLHIPQKTEKQSFLSEHWSKYGYRETKEDLWEVIRKEFAYVPSGGGPKSQLTNVLANGLSWENDEWNLLDIMRIVSDFHGKNYGSRTNIQLWNVGEVELGMDDKPQEYFLDKTHDEIAGTNDQRISQLKHLTPIHVYDYIEQKINWTPS